MNNAGKLRRRKKLGFLPTPLHELKRLSKNYPEYRIYIKRDDQTGLATGGNKTRKLEYLIYEALARGTDTVLTAGAQQSNHCRQTAAACAVSGLECHLLLGGTEPSVYEGNLLLSKMLGANIHFTGENRKGEDLANIKEGLQRNGRNCYVIPYGGSNLTGAMGYVRASGELKSQLHRQELHIDHIFFASSSGGMQAGLTLGKELFGLDFQLNPVNIDKEELHGLSVGQTVLNIVHEGLQTLGLKRQFALSDIPLLRDYDKSGYGMLTDEEVLSMHELAKNEGIILDPVYTARAFHGMLDQLINRKIPSGSNILFWHTGGIPANFVYAEKLSAHL